MSCRPESAGAGSMPQEINLVETDTDVEERRRQCLEELSVTSRTVPEDAAATELLGSEAEQKGEGGFISPVRETACFFTFVPSLS